MFGELRQEVGGCLRRTAGVCLRCGEPAEAVVVGGGGAAEDQPPPAATRPAPPAPPPSPARQPVGAGDRHQPQVLHAPGFESVAL